MSIRVGIVVFRSILLFFFHSCSATLVASGFFSFSRPFLLLTDTLVGGIFSYLKVEEKNGCDPRDESGRRAQLGHAARSPLRPWGRRSCRCGTARPTSVQKGLTQEAWKSLTLRNVLLSNYVSFLYLPARGMETDSQALLAACNQFSLSWPPLPTS